MHEPGSLQDRLTPNDHSEGEPSVLTLAMPALDAVRWHDGLIALRAAAAPQALSRAHWSWVVSCLKASARHADECRGLYVRRSELRCASVLLRGLNVTGNPLLFSLSSKLRVPSYK